MAGASDYLENKLNDHWLRVATFTVPAALFLELYTVAPTDAGGGTPVSGGSYARTAMTFAASAAGVSATSAIVQFPVATANWGEVLAQGIFDASSGGNFLGWQWLASGQWLFTAVASTDIFTAPGHTFSNNDRAVIQAVEGVSTLPTGGGIAGDTVYWIISVSGNTFQLSTTQGGAAINFTADGAGLVIKLDPKTININDRLEYASGAYTVRQA